MLKIGNHKISINSRPKIIAEISANHNQSLSKVKLILIQLKVRGKMEEF